MVPVGMAGTTSPVEEADGEETVVVDVDGDVDEAGVDEVVGSGMTVMVEEVTTAALLVGTTIVEVKVG